MPSQYSHISSTRCVIGQHRQKARSTLEPLRMFRQAMRAVAGSGRALELNIGGPIRPWIAQWWAEEGGRAITFGSDAHTTDWLAGNFYEAMAMAEHFGFRPGHRPEDFWTR